MYETMSKEVIKERGNGAYSSLFILLIKLYNLATLKIPDAMVPVNEAEYEFMNAHKRKKALIATIPHGVNTSIFKPIRAKKSGKVIVGYVGRLAPIKYPEVALEIFKDASKNAKNAEFWWIGSLDSSFKKDYFEKLKKKIGIKNAKYLGQIDNKKLPKTLGKMDIFLQAEQQKNVSRSTTEAAACGLPVVAFNLGKEPFGFFTKDRQKAVEELAKLIENGRYRAEKGREARKIIEKDYSEESSYGKFVKIFERAKNGRE
jgi:glycosyltransferase involved in cell wall biosynthesis